MNKQELISFVDQKFQKEERRAPKIGDTVRVSVRITEGNTNRIQVFEGVVIAVKGHGGARNFIVRKISFGIGVERTFPLSSPAIEKLQVVRSGHVRRSKLYYLRRLAGKAARLEEKETVVENLAAPKASDAEKKKPKTTNNTTNPPKEELVTAKPK